jgi:hypothetical protein
MTRCEEDCTGTLSWAEIQELLAYVGRMGIAATEAD